MITFSSDIDKDPDINYWINRGWLTCDQSSRGNWKYIMFVSDSATLFTDGLNVSKPNGYFLKSNDRLIDIFIRYELGRVRHVFISNEYDKIIERRDRLNRDKNINLNGEYLRKRAVEDYNKRNNITSFR